MVKFRKTNIQNVEKTAKIQKDNHSHLEKLKKMKNSQFKSQSFKMIIIRKYKTHRFSPLKRVSELTKISRKIRLFLKTCKS